MAGKLAALVGRVQLWRTFPWLEIDTRPTQEIKHEEALIEMAALERVRGAYAPLPFMLEDMFRGEFFPVMRRKRLSLLARIRAVSPREWLVMAATVAASALIALAVLLLLPRMHGVPVVTISGVIGAASYWLVVVVVQAVWPD